MDLKKLNLNSKFEFFLGIIKKYIYVYIKTLICSQKTKFILQPFFKVLVKLIFGVLFSK